MNIERAILTSFLGNYLINTPIAGLVALIPAAQGKSIFTPQYISFVVLALIVVAIISWWHMKDAERGWKGGLYFGITGFIVAIVTAFITGISGVLAQTGSFAQVGAVLPNFWPFLWNWTTLVLLGYWIIPSVLVGLWMAPKMSQKPQAAGMHTGV